MTDDRKALSDTELSVLKVLWQLGPSPVRSVLKALPARDWAYTTAKTILSRLEEKGYVGRDRSGQPHIFGALVGRDDLIQDEIATLRSRVCDGEVGPLVRALVGRELFSREDLVRLRARLDEFFEEER